MIRPFDWRDVGLVKTLSEQGVCLDAETGLTRGTRSLRNALLDYLMPGTGAPTIVWRADAHNGGRQPAEPTNGSTAFGQLHHQSGSEQARILLIAPKLSASPEGWLPIIEKLAAAAGERGAHNLLAEADEDSDEFASLRAAGFAIYARQSLWKLSGPARATGASAPLRTATNADGFGVSTLYANVVPRLVQQVEPPPAHVGGGYVLVQGGEVIAYLDVRRGPLGVWVEPCLHPEAYELSEAVLHTGLRLIGEQTPKPIYICVRRYHDWLGEILERAGFAAMGSQAVLVKRLAARVTEPLLKPLPVVEGSAPHPVARVNIAGRDDERAARPPAGHAPDWYKDYAETNHGRFARIDGGDSGADWRSAAGRQPHRRPAGSHPRLGPRAHGALH